MVATRPRRMVQQAPAMKPLAPDFAAVERMSDATGMLQHSIYSIPDRQLRHQVARLGEADRPQIDIRPEPHPPPAAGPPHRPPPSLQKVALRQ